LIHSSIGIVVMGLTGLLVGWRIREGLANAVLAYLVLLLFGFSMIWLGIWVGSLMRSTEAVNGFMFTVMFPLTFVANTFAPPQNMPTWLRVIAEWNPVSALTAACRDLWGNGPAAAPDAQWPMHHPVVASIGWSILFTAIFAPLALMAFRRRSQD
jgi:ABC-type multidrug transport system permease subunit